MHKFGAFNVCLGTDDFGFWKSLCFGCHGEISLEFLWHGHVFDEDLFDKDSWDKKESTPFIDFLIDELFDGVWYGLSFFKKVLECIFAADSSESGIRYLSHSLHDILDGVICCFRVHESVVNAGINIDSDVVFREDKLTIQVNDSKIIEKVHGFEINWMNYFSTGVNGMQARLKSLSESAKSLFQADESLSDLFVGVGTPAAGTGTPSSETSGTPATTVKDTFVTGGFVLFVVA